MEVVKWKVGGGRKGGWRVEEVEGEVVEGGGRWKEMGGGEGGRRVGGGGQRWVEGWRVDGGGWGGRVEGEGGGSGRW